jgi:iron complex outermembrane receptor protein
VAQESAPSSAQPTDTAGAGLSQIIVTAQRRAENVQEIPLTVNAIGADAIAERGLNSLQDIATATAGVKFNETSNVGNVTIRGVGTAIISGGGESSAALHVDGIYIAQTKAYPLTSFDLAGVEILRGPQGTLYGRNSTAGVINEISRAPSSSFGAGGFIQYGNYDRREAGAYVTGPLGERFRARLYAEGEDRDGYITNTVTGQSLEDKRSLGVRGALDGSVTGWWTTELRYTHARERAAQPVTDGYYASYTIVPVSLMDLDPYRVSTPTRYSGTRQLDLVSWRNSFDLSERLQLVALSGYSKFSNENTFDVFGSLLPVPETVGTSTDSLSQELLLKGDGDRLSWLVGAYYFRRHETNHSFADFSNLYGFSSLTVIAQKSVQSSASLFGDATYAIAPHTKVFAGARELREKLHQDLYTAGVVNGATVVQCSPETDPESVAQNALTGRLGVQQDVAEDAMIYGQYSRGYKAPGFSQSACRNAYGKETVDALETGLKSEFLGRRLRFNVSAFYNSIKGLQIEIANPLGIPSVNVPLSRVYGMEIETSLKPDTRLTLDASISLLHARYIRLSNQDTNLGVPLGASLSGVHLNNAPNFSGTFGAGYRIPVGSAASLTARGDVYVTTKYNLREVNEPYTIQGGYTQTSLSLTYRSSDDTGYYVRGYGKNLENKAVLAGVIAFGGVEGTFQPPRTFGVEAGYKF